ncbi:pyruvate, phosphate dikinase [Abyssisolibacter fermentans]|uniref:pyruvate, phosphate dikinase n=1 Tax=Abyssisolibacter fermentans TaxID=1766203 RepID=UPI000836FEA7|nr:pyruvate, phosphate dikinase [Abyssisolibacter fermentans]
MTKFVYSFEEGNKDMKPLLGGKGANLAEMKKIGLPVPLGFTITTQACNAYYENNKNLGSEMESEIFNFLEDLEKKTGKTFGSIENPLLVSVRSGAVISMPGMMDTVLNLGLNDDTVKGLAELTNNERFAYDSYRRFIQMFGDVVLHIPKYEFDRVLDEIKRKINASSDTELTVDALKDMIKKYKNIIKRQAGINFPNEPKKQLLMSVRAVFDSWNNQRAIIYRNINDIPHDLGTAVNVQSMVFGNMGETSGTGVAFTRNPATGENKVFGEYLLNAQGEDVVAGIRTPQSIDQLKDFMSGKIYNQFMEIAAKLEMHYRDMQDIEFTFEKGNLYLLQTRTGKRTATAAIKVAVDLVAEGKITKEEALMRIDPMQINQLLHPVFDEDELNKANKLAKGLPASPGAASGKVYFSSEHSAQAASNGEKTILVRIETSPEDIEGMNMSQGILTARGGMTSHAAVVARGMGKCCVAGCGELKIDEERKILKVNDEIIKEGEYISLDGNTGNVYKGIIKTKAIELSGNFGKIMQWADEVRRLKIRTNADTPRDAKTAVDFGAEGIGLCRTEHMFFAEARIPIMRQMIVSDTKEDRIKALDRLFDFQKEDFVGIFRAMGERPVTIRLLDPPLHEFLPQNDDDIKVLADNMNIAFQKLKDKVLDLKEFNPMLGHRGCRLAITYPEIYQMQAKAVITAAIEVSKQDGLNIKPEIMIPLVGHAKELEILRKLVDDTAKQTLKENSCELQYYIGTMIEIPRAALTADEVARYADFFSFGTNDLTQMTFGFSRDDAGKFIDEYKNKEIFENDPFTTIDVKGVGSLVRTASKLGRLEKENLKLGICGEHGGDPKSIEFCEEVGLDYVSCSPYRVPIARLAAAQAVIKKNN